MREEMTRVAGPVLDYGLQLRDRLLRGEQPALQVEQAVICELMLSDSESRRIPEFGGEPEAFAAAPRFDSEAAETKIPFLGGRYALACWLDEMFVLDSPWAEQWNEHKLEVRLYGSNDRAWRFWEQARLAMDRASSDALEVYFLCVMLGFTGEMIDTPAKLAEWSVAARTRLVQARTVQWVGPPERPPMTQVPPLDGRHKLQRMLAICGISLLLLVPLVAFVLAQRL